MQNIYYKLSPWISHLFFNFHENKSQIVPLQTLNIIIFNLKYQKARLEHNLCFDFIKEEGI